MSTVKVCYTSHVPALIGGELYTLIEESGIDITYRDELYRTARDVSLQANQPNNAAEIDRYVMAQAVIGRLYQTLSFL